MHEEATVLEADVQAPESGEAREEVKTLMGSVRDREDREAHFKQDARRDAQFAYVELLKRHESPKPDDTDMALELIEVLGLSVEDIERDIAALDSLGELRREYEDGRNVNEELRQARQARYDLRKRHRQEMRDADSRVARIEAKDGQSRDALGRARRLAGSRAWLFAPSTDTEFPELLSRDPEPANEEPETVSQDPGPMSEEAQVAKRDPEPASKGRVKRGRQKTED